VELVTVPAPAAPVHRRRRRQVVHRPAVAAIQGEALHLSQLGQPFTWWSW
jgi:hypothetical protein